MQLRTLRRFSGTSQSGAYPNLVPRLNDYLKMSSAESAKAFLRYQGPELFKPFCKAAIQKGR